MLRSPSIRIIFVALIAGLVSVACAPGPSLVPPLTGAVQLDARWDHACVVTTGGAVKCWGPDRGGSLGNIPLDILGGTSSNVALDVSSISGATQVAGGADFTCAVLFDGHVKCWGRNLYGQLGDGTNSNSNVAVEVSGIADATQVSASGAGACALVGGGAVKCWGYNYVGELGNGTFVEGAPYGSNTPVDVTGISGATQGSAAADHACALMSDGSAKCWGNNASGELGNGTTAGPSSHPQGSTVPVDVSGLVGATQIVSGGGETCALMAGGTAKCWGSNHFGQLGDGTTSDSNVPVDVSGVTGATQIEAGFGETCALMAGGTAKCWGFNESGQLGNGTKANSTTPVSVVGLVGATSLSAGTEGVCAVMAGGTAKCWGRNDLGQLGNGTNTGSTTPSTVLQLS